MPTKTSQFVKYIREDCRNYNTVLELTKWKSVMDDNEKIEGFFDTPRRNKKGKIKVAAGGKKTTWLHTLAHEYAHFEYWKKNQTFRKSYILDEKRTEERAIEILIEWNLPINIEVRIKKSKEYIKTLNNR